MEGLRHPCKHLYMFCQEKFLARIEAGSLWREQGSQENWWDDQAVILKGQSLLGTISEFATVYKNTNSCSMGGKSDTKTLRTKYTQWDKRLAIYCLITIPLKVSSLKRKCLFLLNIKKPPILKNQILDSASTSRKRDRHFHSQPQPMVNPTPQSNNF